MLEHRRQDGLRTPSDAESTEQPSELTQERLFTFCERIPLESLPKTFLDAVVVTATRCALVGTMKRRKEDGPRTPSDAESTEQPSELTQERSPVFNIKMFRPNPFHLERAIAAYNDTDISTGFYCYGDPGSWAPIKMPGQNKTMPAKDRKKRFSIRTTDRIVRENLMGLGLLGSETSAQAQPQNDGGETPRRHDAADGLLSAIYIPRKED